MVLFVLYDISHNYAINILRLYQKLSTIKNYQLKHFIIAINSISCLNRSVSVNYIFNANVHTKSSIAFCFIRHTKHFLKREYVHETEFMAHWGTKKCSAIESLKFCRGFVDWKDHKRINFLSRISLSLPINFWEKKINSYVEIERTIEGVPRYLIEFQSLIKLQLKKLISIARKLTSLILIDNKERKPWVQLFHSTLKSPWFHIEQWHGNNELLPRLRHRNTHLIADETNWW